MSANPTRAFCTEKITKCPTQYLPPLFCFGLTHAPKKAVGFDREGIDKPHLTFASRWGLTEQISLIGQCVGRQPLHATGGFAQVGFTSRGQFRASIKFYTFAGKCCGKPTCCKAAGTLAVIRRERCNIENDKQDNYE